MTSRNYGTSMDYLKLFSRFCALSVLAVSLLITGCAVGSSDDDDSSGSSDGGSNTERSFSVSSVTDTAGRAVATFTLPTDTTKFGVTAFVNSSQSVRFTELSDSAGNNFLDPSGDDITFASAFTRGVNSINAPSREVDGPLADFQFTVEVEVDRSGASSSSTQVTFSIVSKADSNLNGGPLRINVFYVGDVGADPETQQITNEALDVFASIYQNRSIALQITELEISGPITLPAPFDGASIYEQASQEGPTPSVNLFISGDIDLGGGGFSGSDDILGLAPGIPGPPVPSLRSAVAIGFFAAAGPDGRFDSEDVRVLGETMAHEVGHFLGLFHPVDFEGNSVVAGDPLGDTPTCRFLTECLANPDLARNLMFFTPVSDGQGGFVEQNRLTSEQAGVLNRYVVTD